MIHELTHILTDPAHWFAEGVMDATFFAGAWFFGGRRALRHHDKKVHDA